MINTVDQLGLLSDFKAGKRAPFAETFYFPKKYLFDLSKIKFS